MLKVSRKNILLTIGLILGGYAVILLIMTLILKLKQKSVKKMWVRYFAWFLIIPPILIPLIYSTIIFQVVIFIMSLLAYREYANVVGLGKDKYYSGLYTKEKQRHSNLDAIKKAIKSINDQINADYKDLNSKLLSAEHFQNEKEQDYSQYR